MSDIEGAVNQPAAAPPADSNNGFEQEQEYEFFTDAWLSQSAPQAQAPAPASAAAPTMAAPAATPAPTATNPTTQTENLADGIGDQNANEALTPENQGSPDPNVQEREGFIPRDRFDQVNTRANTLEQELAQEREQNRLRDRAMDAGYRSVAEYQQADTWAKQNNYASIEEYLELAAYNADLNRKVQAGQMTEDLRQDLLRDKQERIRTQHELNQVRGLLQTVSKSTLDQTLTNAKAQFGDVNPKDWAEIEKLCRDIGRPEAVQRVINTFLPVMQSKTKTAAQQAVIDHNARNAANRTAAAPPPEGAAGGGQAPPPSFAQITPQQAKSRLLSDLLGFRS